MVDIISEPLEHFGVLWGLFEGVVTVHYVEVTRQKGLAEVLHRNKYEVAELLVQLRVLLKDQRSIHLK